jgi:hypothetical protein
MTPKQGMSARGGRADLEHDPEKWIPVFGKDHAQRKNLDPAATKRLPAFALMATSTHVGA